MQAQTLDVAKDWELLEAQLPSDWQELGKQHGLLCRELPKHLGAKITELSQILRLVFYYVATNTSLRIATAAAAAAGMVVLSPVALYKWLCKLGPFVTELAARMLDTKTLFSVTRWAGLDVLLVDATAVMRPGACGTTARVHNLLRLSTLELVQMEVTDVHEGETLCRFRFRSGQLCVGDRIYANPPGIAHVVGQGAHVLVRYNRGSLPLYDIQERSIDVLERLRKLTKPGRVRQWYAQVQPEQGPVIPGRLCAIRLPKDKADQSQERVRRELGSKVNDKALEMACYVVVFTTVPKDVLSAERVLELYRLRWQVELHIKRDKSIAGLDRLPCQRPDTIQTWLCTKLLLIRMARQLASAQVVLPAKEVTPATARQVKRESERREAQIVAEPWRVMKLVWQALCGALLPIRLWDVPRALKVFVDHLRRYCTGRRERQADAFLRHLLVDFG